MHYSNHLCYSHSAALDVFQVGIWQNNVDKNVQYHETFMFSKATELENMIVS